MTPAAPPALVAGLLLATALGLAYAGFALLALTLDRNWKAVAATASGPARGPALAPPPSWTDVRASGYLLLALAFMPLLARDAVASFAIVSWVLWLGVAAALVAFTLAWRPHWLRPLASALASGPAEDRPPARDGLCGGSPPSGGSPRRVPPKRPPALARDPSHVRQES
ncbi:MAG: DUF3325 domain-containing protein [Bacteroidota bacterium]